MGASMGGQAPDYGQQMMGGGGGKGGAPQPPQYGGQFQNMQNLMQNEAQAAQAQQNGQQSFAPGSLGGGDPAAMQDQMRQAMQNQNFGQQAGAMGAQSAMAPGSALAPGSGVIGNLPAQQGMQNQLAAQQAAMGKMALPPGGGGGMGMTPGEQGMLNAQRQNAAGGANQQALAKQSAKPMQKPMPAAAPAPSGVMGVRQDAQQQAKLQRQALKAQALRGG